MEYLFQYISVGIVVVGGCFGAFMKLKSSLEKRPKFEYLEDTYTRKDVCNEIHKSVDEKLKWRAISLRVGGRLFVLIVL